MADRYVSGIHERENVMKTAAETGQWENPPFFGTICEEVSSELLVMNSRGEFLQTNRVSETPAGKAPEIPLRKCLGDLLGCVDCGKSKTCGKGRRCNKCVVWKLRYSVYLDEMFRHDNHPRASAAVLEPWDGLERLCSKTKHVDEREGSDGSCEQQRQ